MIEFKLKKDGWGLVVSSSSLQENKLWTLMEKELLKYKTGATVVKIIYMKQLILSPWRQMGDTVIVNIENQIQPRAKIIIQKPGNVLWIHWSEWKKITYDHTKMLKYSTPLCGFKRTIFHSFTLYQGVIRSHLPVILHHPDQICCHLITLSY